MPAITTLAQQCAPEIAIEAIVPLVLTESGGDPLRLNVNRGPRVRARSAAAGAAIVRRYVALGYTVDVGLAQINSANFARLGVTPEQVFDPCTNLRLAATVLQQNYGLATRHYSGLDAISATYSLYNTGTLTRGMRNGYVGRVWSAATGLGSIAAPPPLPASVRGSSMPALPSPLRFVGDDRADWIVGPIADDAVQVFE